MKLYLAPMEALTGYIFRNVYNRYFGDADRYFTPFIASRKLNSKEKNDVLPEHNQNMDVFLRFLQINLRNFVTLRQDLRNIMVMRRLILIWGVLREPLWQKTGVRVFLPYRTSLTAFLKRSLAGRT